MEKYHPKIFRLVRGIVGDWHISEDVCQEVLTIIYRKLSSFRHRSQFSTWLMRIVINAALMRRRSQRARPAVSLDDPPREDELPLAERFADTGPSPEQVCADNELREMLEEDLEELSPLLRSAFLLREIEGLTTEEAAKTLRVSQNTLKARLWRARQQLADKLRRRLRRNDSVATGPQGGRFGLGAMSYACGTD